MGGWYWIGVLAGLGAALGVASSAILLRWPFAALAGAIAGAAIGIGLFHWPEAVAGAVGGVSGAFGASPLVTGALRRGGTRFGLAVFVLLGAIVVAGVAFIPVAGYLEVVLLPAVGLRARRRAPAQHAGLRILARD
jgi:hypothetical protein